MNEERNLNGKAKKNKEKKKSKSKIIASMSRIRISGTIQPTYINEMM